jgi:hypothetical protein
LLIVSRKKLEMKEKRSSKNDFKKFPQRAYEYVRIGNRGVQEAIAESKMLGLPIVFSKEGIIYYEMPNGTITTKSPFKKRGSK